MAHSAATELRVIQLGMNTADLVGSLRLFTEALGFANAGSQAMWGSTIAVQGLPHDARTLMWWMVGAQDFFQLELFHHSRPEQRPLRPDWSPADHGWCRFGIALGNFDACMTALAINGVSTLTAPRVEQGLRRVAFRDPFVGVIVEVIEKPEARGPEILYVTSSVSNLESAREFYADVLRLETLDGDTLHASQHQALWGLPAAQYDNFLVRAGAVWVEVVCYRSPMGRPRPADYRTSDQGIVNVAFGARDKAPVAAAFARLSRAGYVPPQLFESDGAIGGYIVEPEREIELAVIPVELDARLGFTPGYPFVT